MAIVEAAVVQLLEVKWKFRICILMQPAIYSWCSSTAPVPFIGNNQYQGGLAPGGQGSFNSHLEDQAGQSEEVKASSGTLAASLFC
jgi:hypothetical protein